MRIPVTSATNSKGLKLLLALAILAITVTMTMGANSHATGTQGTAALGGHVISSHTSDANAIGSGAAKLGGSVLHVAILNNQ